MRILHRMLFTLIAATAAAAPLSAIANDGTPPKVFEMIQNGQDVTVTFGIMDPFGEPDIDQAFDLVRSGPEGTVKVISAKVFDPSEGELREVSCHDHDFGDPEAYCAQNPSLCEDCDGDGEAECPMDSSLIGCAGFITFDAVDQCVPPGETTYLFQTPDNDSKYMRGAGSLVVEDSGEECTTDDDADSADDVTGCSVSGIGGGGSVASVVVAALMGLLGLAVLRRS